MVSLVNISISSMLYDSLLASMVAHHSLKLRSLSDHVPNIVYEPVLVRHALLVTRLQVDILNHEVLLTTTDLHAHIYTVLKNSEEFLSLPSKEDNKVIV